MLEEQAASKKDRILIKRIAASVNEGQSLSKSLRASSKSFSGFILSVVAVGEASGGLSANLQYASEELAKSDRLKRTVLAACLYPALITAATICVVAFLMLYLFPKITPIFISLHTRLPLSTRTLIALSNFAGQWGLVVLAGVCVFVIGFAAALTLNARLRFLFDTSILRLPLMGRVFSFYHVSTSARMLGLLLRSGMELSQATVITAGAMGNRAYKTEVSALAKAVEQGGTLAAHMRTRLFYFPATAVNLVAVGERSGTLSQTLLYIAELYDSEVDDFAKRLSTLLEPMLMIVMGLIVGFIAVSIITPIYGITQSIHS